MVYGTGREKLEKIPIILKEAIEKHPETEFGRVHFKEFGDFSLNFEVVFYVLDWPRKVGKNSNYLERSN